MKSLIAGLVLILLIGIGGFLYRNVLERTGEPQPIACTAEAKICPDGSSVGRTGPNCEFTACPSSNMITFADAKISFALPVGYVKGVQRPGADGEVENMLGFYQKPALGSSFHYLSVYQFPIPTGKNGTAVILANTVFSPSGEPATDLSKFKQIMLNGKTFQSVVIERFEGQVVSSYYLVRTTDVLRFDIIETDVDWTNPDLVVGDLPEHKALVAVLNTLQVGE
jgi:hypothetical protein